MQLSLLFVTGVAAAASSFITARGVDCSFETTADLGATCDDFASSWGLSVDNLKALNPGITCPGLNTDLSYCVIGEVTNEPDPSSTKEPSTTPKPTSTPKLTSTHKLTSNTSPTTLKTSSKTSASGSKPTNTMPGLAANCDGWDKVVTNDNCETISKRNGISKTQFASYNPQLDSSMFLTTCFAIQHLTRFRLLQPLAGLLCLRPRVSRADHTQPDSYLRSFLEPTCQRADARYCEQLQDVPQSCER